MKYEKIKINRAKFIILVYLILFQFSFLRAEGFDSKEYRDGYFSFNEVKYSYNKSRLFHGLNKNGINNNIRFLAETIKDKYQNVKTNDLAVYSHSSRSQEYFIDDYLIQLTTSYNEEKVLDGTYQNEFDISIIDLDDCKKKL